MGCKEWQGNRNAAGYGRVFENGRAKLAHRVAWEEAVGPIPEGMFVLHHCDNPPCVNVAHLYVGTQQDNIDDAVRRGRLPRGREHYNRKKTHCPHGHEYTPENTLVRRGGRERICRACQRAHTRRYRARLRGLDVQVG